MQFINHKIPAKLELKITKFRPNSAEKPHNSSHKQFVKSATLAELHIRIRQKPPKISNFGGIMYQNPPNTAKN